MIPNSLIHFNRSNPIQSLENKQILNRMVLCMATGDTAISYTVMFGHIQATPAAPATAQQATVVSVCVWLCACTCVSNEAIQRLVC